MKLRLSRLSPAAILLVLLCLPSAGALAREMFVDFANPKADDKGPGTMDQPLKTIQVAVDAAKPGDTIYLREGFWDQKTRINNRGTRNAPITLCAYKDEKVRMGSQPKPLPSKEAWKKIEGTKSWQVAMPEGTPDDIIVLFDDKPQPCQQLDTAPKDDQVLWSTYRKSDRTLMVNAGGPNPAERFQLTQARDFEGLISLEEESANWIVRGIEFGYARGFIVMFGTDLMLEDCYFHHAYRRAVFGTGRMSTIRRCTFNDAALHGAGTAAVIEDNIFYKGSRNWEEDIAHRVMNYHEGSGGIMFKGIGYATTFRYNFCDEEGFWPDGDGTGTRLYGNAFHDGNGYAVYNEFADDDTLVIGNYMGNCQAGVASSYSSRIVVLDNFITGPGSGVIFHNRDKLQMRDSFMTMRGNAIVGSPVPLSGYGASFERFPEGWTNCLVDFNHYRYKEEGGCMVDLNGKVRCKTIEDERKTLGWDLHGDAKFYDPKNNDLTPESLGAGTVTVRTPVGNNGWKSREMLSDPRINCKWPAAVRFHHTTLPGFFWRVADGDYNASTLNRWGHSWENPWAPECGEGYGEGQYRGCAWYMGAEQPTDGRKLEWSGLLDESDGNKFLVVSGKTPKDMPPQGAGWWTPVLPTAPEAKINVSFKVRGVDLKADDAKGGPVVFARFTGLTGQNTTRVYLVGCDDAGQVVRPDLTQGSFDWAEIKQTITAPKTAAHVAIFLGLRPATGKVHFDDINLKTEPGPMPESAKLKECLPPRLPLQRFRETFTVDLSKFANRAFADDEANNGKGGWSDQGPNCDMREVKTGKRRFGGVPFDLLPAPNSVVVLKGSRRAPGNLPVTVNIPVGRKVDTLFFLHSAAWFGEFKYVLHYADEKDVTITMNSKNMTDWAADPKASFPAEEGTYTTVAETVPNPQFKQGSFYRTEWSAPADRRGVKLASIEFINSGDCIPILIAITGVLEW